MIAVLTTSDIQAIKGVYDDSPVVSSFEHLDKTYEMVSCGIMEKAIAQGHTVYVITSRPKFGSHDEWWIDMVGKDHVIKMSYDPTHGCANDPITMRDCASFFRDKLGVKPPAGGYGMTCYQDIVADVRKRGHIKTAQDFR